MEKLDPSRELCCKFIKNPTINPKTVGRRLRVCIYEILILYNAYILIILWGN